MQKPFWARRLKFAAGGVVVLASTCLSSALLASPSVASPAPTGESYAAKVMLARQAAYLPVDRASLARATAAPTKGLTHKYGLWVTSAEAKSIDAHFAFEENVHKSLLPYAEKQPGYAGAWFDRANNGQLVIQTKKPTTSLLSQLVSRLPAGPAGVRVQTVKLSEPELQARVNAISAAWGRTVSSAKFISIAARTPTSRVLITVDAATLTAANKVLPTLRQMAAPAAVTLQTGSWVNNQNASCSDRSHCTSPMKAGDVIYKSDGTYCTMGIMIKTSGGDDQFTTSGHCGSGTWYHSGYGALGSQISTLDNSTRGVDLQRVQMPNTHAGNTIYGLFGVEHG